MNRLFLIICFFGLQCHSEDNDLQITIERGQQAEIDLMKGAFRVKRISASDTTIKFELSEQERIEIVRYYYLLKLHQIGKRVLVNDNCYVMPKIYTILNIQTKSKKQVIQIDDDCKQSILPGTNFEKVVMFLKRINSILNSKPTLKNLPDTDVFYL